MEVLHDQNIDRSTTPTVASMRDNPGENVLEASALKKYGLLAIFNLAQFLDACSNSMLFPALFRMTTDLDLTGSQGAWLFAAYQATFASFLLVSGRISDIYSPKPIFIAGNIILGVMSLGAGFVHNKIGLLVLRGFSGIGAAFTIPSALNLIVKLFPNDRERSRAVSWFGTSGAIGNVSGLLMGGILVEFANWHWIFFLITLIAIPIAVICFIFIPPQPIDQTERPNLDVIGISALTVAILLFVFGVTSGSNDGWKAAGVIIPLVLSVILTASFFWWETRLDERNAALPPKMWYYPNFSVLFGVALYPILWWVSVYFLLPPLWQETYHWSTIMIAVRFLPIGVGAGVVGTFAGSLPNYFPVKWILLTGCFLAATGTVLLPFASTESRYWPFIFPALWLGSIGTMLVFSNTNVAFFQNTPRDVAGTVGAVYNAALQLGSGLGLAALTSIQTSIDQKSPTANHGYAGRAAAFWAVLGVIGVEAAAIAIFYRTDQRSTSSDVETPQEGDEKELAVNAEKYLGLDELTKS